MRIKYQLPSLSTDNKQLRKNLQAISLWSLPYNGTKLVKNELASFETYLLTFCEYYLTSFSTKV